MKKLICLLVFSFITSLVLAQNKEIDSLEYLVTQSEGKERVKHLQALFEKQLSYKPKDALNTVYQTWEIVENLEKGRENTKLKVDLAQMYMTVYSSVLKKHDSTIYWSKKAMKWSEEIKDSLGILNTYRNIARSFYYQKKIDSAFIYYSNAMELSEKIKQPQELVKSYDNMAMMYNITRQFEKSLEFRKKAYNLAKKHNYEKELLKISVNLGALYRSIDLDSAIFYTRNAVKIAKNINSNIGLHRAMTSLANFLYLKKENQESLRVIEQVINMPKEKKDPHYELITLITYSGILKQNGRYEDAKNNIYKTLKLTESQSNDIQTAGSYTLLGVVYGYLNEPDSTDMYIKKSIALKNTITQQEILAKTSELQTKYETEKKEQQIKDLEQQKTINELKSKTEISSLQAQRSILGLVLLAPISLLIGGGWYVNRRRLYLKLEAEQKERAKQLSELKALRSQMNPHFIFNALNSIQDFIMLSEKENAQHYLGKFATLMRGFLDSSSKEKISLEKELPLLKSYIELEGLRLGEEFSYEIIFNNKIDEEQLEEIEIPPLLIQPYLENAFKHGLLHKMGEKKLLLEFDKVEKQNENFLQLKITDNGVGRQKSTEINARKAKTHQSFATQATEERLELMKNQSVSNKNIEVKINDLKDEHGNAKGTEIVILIPINE